MKRMLTALLALILGVVIVGCSGSKDTGSGPDAKREPRMKKPEGVK